MVEKKMKNKKVLINILIGKEVEDLLKLIDKKELKALNNSIKIMKPVLDRLGKKETTDQDIWNFKNLIEHDIIAKIIKDLKWVDNKSFAISREVAIKKLIRKYKKKLSR